MFAIVGLCVCCREYEQQVTARNLERQRFRDANRVHARGNRFTYPSDLCALPSFASWLRSHVQALRCNSFPIPTDVVRLSAAPSKFVSSYSKMWAYGAHFRCDFGDIGATHATCDFGIANLDSDCAQGSIDVGVLERIYMASYGSLKVVVMRVSWLQHVHQGQRCIKRDPYGFWTANINLREEPHRRNRFILPKLATQVFFMDDPTEVGRKMVIVHEPRSRRVFGSDDQPFAAPNGADLDLEIPLPELSQVSGRQRGAPQIVPQSHVRGIDENFLLPVDDSVFDDTQFVEENDVEPEQI